MDDALLVRGGEPRGQLAGELEGAPHRQGPALQRRSQRLAFEQLGDHVGRRALGMHVVDGDDVRMVQRRGGAGFLRETP